MDNNENQKDRQLAERIGKLDDQQVITGIAFAKGLETGKAIYEASKEPDKQAM